MPKKVTKSISKQLQFGFKVFLLPIALPQGQLTEVPIYFKIFTIKVVGQTILAWSTTKMSKLQSNGIIKLGLVKSVVLYYNLTPHELQKCKLKLVTDFQINFSSIDLNQVDHLEVLRGSFQIFWEFHPAQQAGNKSKSCLYPTGVLLSNKVHPTSFLSMFVKEEMV